MRNLASGAARRLVRHLPASLLPVAPPQKGRFPEGQEPNPADPDVIGDFRFFAVVKSWMDEDIIEATVRNIQAQGVDQVYVVDNGSTDATAVRATRADAIVAEVYQSDMFEERLAQALMNAVVARESLRSGAEHVWWIYMDCDEFPEGPDGLLVREYLETLDRRFRIVGAKYANHLPDGKPEYIPGFHPIDFQPLFYSLVPWFRPPCGHWKHSLQRFDRHGAFIQCEGGAHHATGGLKGCRTEPELGITTHHFQYRDEAVTRAKLELICGPGSTRSDWMRTRGIANFDQRARSLDAVYSQRFGDVELEGDARLDDSMLSPWPSPERIRRWYSPADLEAARNQPAQP